MINIFNVSITDRINISSNYNFDRNLNVIITNINNVELYRTTFPFIKNINYWISMSHLDNIIINIVDDNTLLYSYKNSINDDYKDDFAYITCGDIYYMDLIEKLVISLLNVSNKKIIVYGINCKVPFDYPNLIKRELIIPIKTIHDKWFWKQQSCIESLKENYKNYIWLDGDIIANINIDNLSNHFDQIENYPICEIHIHDEQIMHKSNGETISMCENISKHFNTKRKILKKDLHACCFVYNYNCKWYFEEILNLYHSIYEQGLYDKLLKWNDECLHNFMNTKYNFTKTLPLSNLSLLCKHSKYDYNDKILKVFYSYWNESSPNNFGERYGWSYVPENKNQILYFHENKNLKYADEMINFIKMKKNNSFNTSRYFYINKYKTFNFEDRNLNADDELKNLINKYDECYKYEYKDIINIEPNDVIVDIGANIGFFERFCNLKMASKIICFEPSTEKFRLLKLNSDKNSILFNSNVTDITNNYIIDDKNINDYNINYLFDSLLIDKIDFLKIDSKGYEKLILNNISDINLNKINKISIKWYNDNNNDKDDIMNFYTSKGFDVFVNDLNDTIMIYIYKKKINLENKNNNIINLDKSIKRAISFSIYGNLPKYTIGLLKNLELVEKIYPDWLVYIYYNNTVPYNIIEECKKYSFVRLFDMTNVNIPGMFWRFLPNDVERFISRDTDSRLSMREKYAVDEWIESNKTLHIMRDHPKWHNIKIFGGMFGLIVNEDLKIKIENWLIDKDKSTFNRGGDVEFLNTLYFRYLVKKDIIAHDSYFLNNYPYSKPFPTKLENYRFVGEIFDENDNRQEHYLDWIDKIESNFD